MEDDTRTYTGYFARLVGLIVALILFGLAIWFIVQLGDDETGVVVAPDDDGTAYSVTDNIVGGEGEVVVIDSTDNNNLLAATDTEIAAATNNRETTGELPDTGAAETVLISLAIGAFIISGRRLLSSQRALRSSSLYNRV